MNIINKNVLTKFLRELAAFFEKKGFRKAFYLQNRVLIFYAMIYAGI